MNAFLQGMLLGFSAAVPIGPVNLMIMTAAIGSFWRGFAIAFGAMVADVFYLVLLAFGVLGYLQGELVSKVIGVFGVCYLLYIAFVILKNADKPIKTDAGVKVSKANFGKNFAKGFFVTLANPYTVGFWLSVASFAKSFENAAVVVAGLIVAITIWITLMPFFVHKSAKVISQKVAKWINIVCALILCGFAVSLVFKFIY